MPDEADLREALRRFVSPLPPDELGRLYSRRELAEDLDFMVGTMEEVHPDLFFRLGREGAADAVANARHRLRDGLTRLEAYRELANLAAMFGDGHTKVRMPRDEYARWLEEGGGPFPLDVDCSGGELAVARRIFQDPAIEPGSTIGSINGIAAHRILDSMIALQGFASGEMSLSVVSRHFPLLLFLLYGRASDYRITLEGRDVVLDGKEQAGTDPIPHETDVPYSYEIHAVDGYAVLDFRSFSAPDRFRSFAREMFGEIASAGVRRLIVDLRNNGGGNSMLTGEFVSYVTDRPFREKARTELKVSRRIREYYSKLTRYFARFPLSLLPARFVFPAPWKGRLGETVVESCHRRRPARRRPRFAGDLIVLTGPYTFSAASDFAAVIKDNGIGTIVGRPTGGLATSYGDSYPFSLPNTHLECGVSHKLFVRPSGDETPKPLEPNFAFEADPGTAGDALMEYAIGLEPQRRRPEVGLG